MTLHIFAEDRTDVELKVRQTLWESHINFEALNKDLNNELFIAFLTEVDCDAALEKLMGTQFRSYDKELDIKVGYAPDTIQVAILKNIIATSKQNLAA